MRCCRNRAFNGPDQHGGSNSSATEAASPCPRVRSGLIAVLGAAIVWGRPNVAEDTIEHGVDPVSDILKWVLLRRPVGDALERPSRRAAAA